MTSLLLVTALLAAPAPDDAPPAPVEVEVRLGTVVRFLTAADGARLLSRRDDFVSAMSPFDRAARLKTDREVVEARYLAFVLQQTLEWSADERARIATALESFRDKTAALDLRLPATISLVKTTGREEGNAAYCRGAAVVIPQSKASAEPAPLERLIFHELFHIYRAHHDDNRRELYALIGFEVCPEIELPESLRARKITNPDAPRIDSFIHLDVHGERIAATPVLYARTERYDVEKGGEFFESMVFRLLVLDEVDGALRPASLPDGALRLLDPSKVPDYLERVGRNTGYIIHPEEILAENFVLMALGEGTVRTPRVVEGLRKLLARETTK